MTTIGHSSPRFENLTETTGVPLSPEAASMMYTRYRHAADLARGRRVLEVGCGSGQGFSLLRRAGAAGLVGGDYSLQLLRSGSRHYGPAASFVRLSADSLPFGTGTADLLLCFEASYYVRDMEAAFSEFARVLRPGGTVLFVNANPERPDFIRSPHSVHYHSADEFRSALERHGFAVSIEGAFPVSSSHGRGLVGATMRLARRVFEALGIVPRTLRGRARLKRLLYGPLLEVPAELPDAFGALAPRIALPSGRIRDFKVLYVRGDRRG